MDAVDGCAGLCLAAEECEALVGLVERGGAGTEEIGGLGEDLRASAAFLRMRAHTYRENVGVCGDGAGAEELERVGPGDKARPRSPDGADSAHALSSTALVRAYRAAVGRARECFSSGARLGEVQDVFRKALSAILKEVTLTVGHWDGAHSASVTSRLEEVCRLHAWDVPEIPRLVRGVHPFVVIISTSSALPGREERHLEAGIVVGCVDGVDFAPGCVPLQPSVVHVRVSAARGAFEACETALLHGIMALQSYMFPEDVMSPRDFLLQPSPKCPRFSVTMAGGCAHALGRTFHLRASDIPCKGSLARPDS
jgi:hypothetical protein